MEGDAPGVGTDKAGNDGDQGCLAGTVRPEQPEKFALFDGQRYTTKRL
jgi:hypothetical protein